MIKREVIVPLCVCEYSVQCVYVRSSFLHLVVELLCRRRLHSCEVCVYETMYIYVVILLYRECVCACSAFIRRECERACSKNQLHSAGLTVAVGTLWHHYVTLRITRSQFSLFIVGKRDTHSKTNQMEWNGKTLAHTHPNNRRRRFCERECTGIYALPELFFTAFEIACCAFLRSAAYLRNRSF